MSCLSSTWASSSNRRDPTGDKYKYKYKNKDKYYYKPSKKGWDGYKEKNEETSFAGVQTRVRHHPSCKQSPFCPGNKIFICIGKILNI